MLTPFPGASETIACTDCDCDSPDSLEVAIRQGWIDIEYDNGLGWYYLGKCPVCRKREEHQERKNRLRTLRQMMALIDCHWRPVAIYDSNGDELWVDPVGGRLADFAHACLIHEHRSNPGPETDESINRIYSNISKSITDALQRSHERRMGKVRNVAAVQAQDEEGRIADEEFITALRNMQ